MDGCVADAGDGSEHACPIDLLLCLLTVCRTFDYELREIDLSCSDITLYGWNDCRRKKKRARQDFRELKLLFLDDGSASQVGEFVTPLNIM